jgi:hypothetical protein
MKTRFFYSLCLLITFYGSSLAEAPYEEPQIFSLPDARVGESYRIEVEALLREKYRLRLEGNSVNAILQWALVDGELPRGLTIRSDGILIGAPQENKAESYRFRLKVVDESSPEEPLILEFVVGVKAAAVKLVKINGPMLVPFDSEEATGSLMGLNPRSSRDEHRTPATRAAVDGKSEVPSTASALGEAAEPIAKTASTNEPNDDSTFKRAILGIEQSGASSAASAQNPFVDFFFSKRVSNDKAKRPWLVWGDVKLTTTPQQVAAFASSGANVVGAATGDKINDLATSFDFKIGPELQFNPSKNTSVSLIAGFGAISTLTGPPKVAPIFKVPSASSSQYANFVSQYPEAKAPGASFISFVPQEQDRFYRQYFLGLRVKSYHDGEFPSMFDVTFGQNSAVTEGKLRHFVLGFEGSHRFSLMKNSIYIFGATNLKIGGPKFRSTPFILEPAETTVKLTDPNVVITSRQSNRDFYRIGFGVDLIELFKPANKESH